MAGAKILSFRKNGSRGSNNSNNGIKHQPIQKKKRKTIVFETSTVKRPLKKPIPASEESSQPSRPKKKLYLDASGAVCIGSPIKQSVTPQTAASAASSTARPAQAPPSASSSSSSSFSSDNNNKINKINKRRNSSAKSRRRGSTLPKTTGPPSPATKSKQDARFNMMLHQLKVYHYHHGTCRVDRKIHPTLHSWVANQRLQYADGDLSPERCEKLNAVHDFTWNPKDSPKPDNNSSEHHHHHHQQQQENPSPPSSEEKKSQNDRDEGRQQQEPPSTHRRHSYDAPVSSHAPPPSTVTSHRRSSHHPHPYPHYDYHASDSTSNSSHHHHEEVWNYYFAQLHWFHGLYGHTDVSPETPLYQWLQSQKVWERTGVLPAHHKSLMDALGVVWDAPAEETASTTPNMSGSAKASRSRATSREPEGAYAELSQNQSKEEPIQRSSSPQVDDDEWKEQFDRLIEFKEEHGHTNVPRCRNPRSHHKNNKQKSPAGIPRGVDYSLSTWVMAQRADFKRGEMDPLCARRLLQVGFVPDLETWNSWQARYLRLQHLGPTLAQHDACLSQWICLQRELFHFSALPIDRKEMLDELGFVWEFE